MHLQRMFFGSVARELREQSLLTRHYPMATIKFTQHTQFSAGDIFVRTPFYNKDNAKTDWFLGEAFHLQKHKGENLGFYALADSQQLLSLQFEMPTGMSRTQYFIGDAMVEPCESPSEEMWEQVRRSCS